MSNPIAKAELKDKILSIALPLFKAEGIKSVTVDEIANRAQISKRTLYELYGNKEDLLLACIKRDEELLSLRMAEFVSRSEDEMDILFHFLRLKMREGKKLNKSFITDIQKYRKVVRYLDSNRNRNREYALEFIAKGVEHGFFLERFNYEIIMRFGDAIMQYIMESKMYDQYPMHTIFENYLTLMLRGFCTDKGLKRMEAFAKSVEAE